MDTTDAPQMIEHVHISLGFTPYQVQWIPQTAKFMLCGQQPKATGIINICLLSKGQIKVLQKISRPKGIKCATFASSPPNTPCFTIGCLDGSLAIMDLQKLNFFWDVKNAHQFVVNCVDGVGQGWGYGVSQLVSAGRDGCVRIWDPRQQAPALSLQPVQQQVIPDCWAVAFGNSHNANDRILACGYDNGDVKIFDLRTSQLNWETNLKNGVCGVEFDRKDIMMNKLVATTLQGKFTVFDMRTFHYEQGYASITQTGQKSTIWGVRHLPQNRDIFATLGGNGAINIYKYIYPSSRQLKDSQGKARGVAGRVQLLNNKDLCQQPVSSFEWHRDKIGLGVLCGLDQTCRVIITTKLNLY